jgi:transketolase
MRIGQSIGLELDVPTRVAFGQQLRDLGHEFGSLVVVDADVSNSTRTDLFGRAFPDRFFQVGIAESNMVSVGSGLAACGYVAVVSSFACFLVCNAYDQIRMGVALPRLNVKLVGSHSGVSIGEDGPSQMGIEDIALATSLPGMVVLVPCDAPSTRQATRAMIEYDGPVYLRTSRPKFPRVHADGTKIEIGRAIRLREGKDVTLVGCGLMVAACLEAAYLLESEGLQARVLDMHTIKPLDKAAIASAARESGAIVTAEEHLLDGGLGSAVARAVLADVPVPMGFVGIQDRYAGSGRPDDLLERCGLTAEHIVAETRRVLEREAMGMPDRHLHIPS